MCLCGNNIKRFVQTSITCTLPCSGNSSEYCGNGITGTFATISTLNATIVPSLSTYPCKYIKNKN